MRWLRSGGQSARQYEPGRGVELRRWARYVRMGEPAAQRHPCRQDNREDDRPLEATRYALDGGGWEVNGPLLDRRGPLAGAPDPGPRPEPPGANAMGVIEPAHEDDLNDDG
jgi:hypothetical protein